MITRKEFIIKCLACSAGFYVLDSMAFPGYLFADETTQPYKAKYWEPLEDKKVRCLLCPNKCILLPGEDGLCHARGNRKGVLYSLVFGRPSVIKLDNIEKSPLYHYQVDGKVFSIATAGCNLACQFCQNWEVSQTGPDKVKTFDLDPEEVIERAKKNNVNAINFFYTEPVVYFEYMMEIARLAKEEKMKTFCITAGYINEEPLKELIPFIDAFVIGLKGFDEEFYRKYIGADIEPVKKMIKILIKNRAKSWFEIVNLLIPDLNDDENTIREICRWILNEAGNCVPLHFTRFEPAYKMKDFPPTPPDTLDHAYNIAKECGLNFVYTGNMPGHTGNNTYCPECKKVVIERVDYTVINNTLENGKCSCGYKVPGHWL